MQAANRPRARGPVWPDNNTAFRSDVHDVQENSENDLPSPSGLRSSGSAAVERDSAATAGRRAILVVHVPIVSACSTPHLQQPECGILTVPPDQARGLGRLFEQGCQIAWSAVCEPATEQFERPSVSWLRASASRAKPCGGISRRDSDSKRVLWRVSSQIPRRVRCAAIATIGHRRSSVDDQVSEGAGMMRTIALLVLGILIGAAALGGIAATSSGSDGAVEVRIVAEPLEDGRVEVGLQQRQGDGEWGATENPPLRFVPAGCRDRQAAAQLTDRGRHRHASRDGREQLCRISLRIWRGGRCIVHGVLRIRRDP